MAKDIEPGDWALLTENPEAVLSALAHGETDGILPAASKFMDRFAQFLVKRGVVKVFEEFPDHRKRKWITAFFFCNVLLHKSVFRLRSLSMIGQFLFSCPDVMRALGFQMRQIQEGFYKAEGQHPFNEEAMSDYFAQCELSDYLLNQKAMVKEVLARYPGIAGDGSVVLDVVDIRIAAGKKGRAEQHLDACVLSFMSERELLPVLWNIVEANKEADITQGKVVMSAAIELFGKRIRLVIVDRGFMSGAWVTELKLEHKIDTAIGLKSDMVLHNDMLALSRHSDTEWIRVDPPKYRKGETPKRRICYLSDLDLWDECKVPLSGIVIKDTYKEKVEYYTVVTTDLDADAEQIHEWIRSRWGIEETFMEESRYGCLNHIGSCRRSVAAAMVHFTLLAYTLLRLFGREEDCEPTRLRPQLPIAGIELVAYWKGFYAIMFPSQLVEVVARSAAAWGERLPKILERLRTAEHPP